MKISRNTIGILTLCLSFTLISTGCRKKKDTIAKIYVYDESESPVASANVVLSAEVDQPKGKLIEDMKATTNSKGEAIFNFNDLYQLGQAGVAVLNIKASKADKTGQGIIKVEAEVTSEESVIITN